MYIKELKRKHVKEIQRAVMMRIDELKPTKEYKKLVEFIQDFEENPFDNKYAYLTLDHLLYTNLVFELKDFGLENEENEVIEMIFDQFEGFYFSQDNGQYSATQCLGDAIIYNFSPEKDCWAIYSNSLNLKVDKENLVDERHGWLIIEQAMRQYGIYNPIVETDYYSYPKLISMPKEILALSDEELEHSLEKYKEVIK